MSAGAPRDLDRDELLTAAVRSPDVTARYRSHVVVLEPDGCWWWTGAISSGGHGRFWVRRSVVVIAHRFGWLLEHPGRALPELLAHRCDNPLCQNPAHLHPSDPGDNRRQWAARRHVPGSPLRDTRGARTRALAVRAALLSGESVRDAIAAGTPAVDVGQGTLWDPVDEQPISGAGRWR